MRFTPKTEEDLAGERSKFGPWPNGTYDFEVMEADDATSKAGNDMIVLDLMVYDSHGNNRKVRDWLVETVAAKLKDACRAVGLHAAYDGGNIAARDFVGRSGKLKLGTQTQEGFDPRNKVTGYIPTAAAVEAKRAVASTQARKAAMAGDLDDEIPF